MSLGKGLESLIPKKGGMGAPQSLSSEGEKSANNIASEFSRSAAGSSSGSLKEIPRRQHQRIESIFHIEVEKIKPNPYQPRHEFNEEELKDLCQSIREFGIIQPLVVTKIVKETERGTEVEYQLIAGERRLKAAKMIGLERVPTIVKKLDNERAKLEIALIENIQRSDLNPLESAKAYSRLQDEFNLTQREIAARVGKSRESIANTLRLLNLPVQIQEAISQNKITESQARMLLPIINPEEQMRLLYKFLEKRNAPRISRKENQETINPQKIYWEKQLEEKLGAPVKLLKNGERGKMVIQFYSEEELQGILDKLLGKEEI